MLWQHGNVYILSEGMRGHQALLNAWHHVGLIRSYLQSCIMLPRYIHEMRCCNINTSHEIFVAVLPFIQLAIASPPATNPFYFSVYTLYRRVAAAGRTIDEEGKLPEARFSREYQSRQGVNLHFTQHYKCLVWHLFNFHEVLM